LRGFRGKKRSMNVKKGTGKQTGTAMSKCDEKSDPASKAETEGCVSERQSKKKSNPGVRLSSQEGRGKQWCLL